MLGFDHEHRPHLLVGFRPEPDEERDSPHLPHLGAIVMVLGALTIAILVLLGAWKSLSAFASALQQ
jgi:hypothetical protein